jgi:predicted glycogen debranching enzyme
MLDFGRDICGDLSQASRREWLVSNGIGGYASGTVAGLLTRRYHGLLVAASKPPVGRTLLVTKLDETARYSSSSFPLFANRWSGGRVGPEGYRYLERFRLEGTTPVWTFAIADALLEKRVWMEHGENTTYVRYDLRRASGPLVLSLRAVVNCRDHHANTRGGDWSLHLEPVTNGLQLQAGDGPAPFYLLSDSARFTPAGEWDEGYWLHVESYRGLDARDDNVHAADLEVVLQPGDSFTVVASTEQEPNLDGGMAYRQRQAYEQHLLEAAEPHLDPSYAAVKHLVLAADQFVVRRSVTGALPEGGGRSVIAGYHWFGDWGRDTMIALPGLTLATGRHDLAARILRTFAHYVVAGMLPNRFPDAGEAPEYNTVDATLWYFEAIRAYHEVSGDDALVRDLFPVLGEIVDWHLRGTRYRIRVDPADGLLYAGEPGVQLTWMDAKVDEWVVTPRTGKPVEINALWYNALCIVASFARALGETHGRYVEMAADVAAGFGRFWSADLGYCFDLIDGPEGDDSSLRPNQLFAVSLPHSPLSPEQQRAVVDTCAQHLLTSHGLRSLAPDHPDYQGTYGGDRRTRDGAYHQGTVWGWLIGPFVSAHLRVYRDPALARGFLEPLIRQLDSHGVGSMSEVFDGDPPFTPRGCIAQAWTVAEVLRLWRDIGELAEGRGHGGR